MVKSMIREGGRAVLSNGGQRFAPLRSMVLLAFPAAGSVKNIQELAASPPGSISSSSSCSLKRYPQQRGLSSSTSSYGSGTSVGSSTGAGGGYYESPLQEIFDRMKANGPTALGTTQDILDIEKAFEMHQKKLECGIPENALRFSSTSYGRTLLPPYVHANEHRVIMKINTKDLPFTSPYEFDILREIVGDRLNDERKELRLTSNKFGSRIENKRHLVKMLDRIVLSCQKLGAEVNDESNKAKSEESA
jgi:Mitochondrial ribosomal subunit protein